jgi:hypothetical protein
LVKPIPPDIATLPGRRAEQRHARQAQAVEQLQDPEALSQQVRAGAEGLARLAATALSRKQLTLAHTCLLWSAQQRVQIAAWP